MGKAKYSTTLLFAMILVVSVYGQSNMKNKKPLGNKPKSVAEAVEKVRPSIVQVIVRSDSPTNASSAMPNIVVSRGTGFLVSKDGYVITARHVVRPQLLGANPKLAVAFPIPPLDWPGVMRGVFQTLKATIVAEDEGNDLALLKLERNPFQTPFGVFIQAGEKTLSFNDYDIARLDPNRPQDGAQIAITGYPLDIAVPVTNVGYLATTWEIDTANLREFGRPMTEINNVYLADLRVNHGNSGGPIYSVESGFVIGIGVSFKGASVEPGNPNSAQLLANLPLAYNSGIACVVPIEYAIRLLRQVNASHLALAKK